MEYWVERIKSVEAVLEIHKSSQLDYHRSGVAASKALWRDCAATSGEDQTATYPKEVFESGDAEPCLS